jgi:hypothetical protein
MYLHQSHNFRRTVGAVSAAVFMAASMALFVPACTDRAEASSDEPPLVAGQTVLFVLDLSASMRQPLDVGAPTTRLDAAKTAIDNLVAQLPDDARVGLRVYGDQNDAVAPEQRGDACLNDTRLLVEPGPLDRTEVTATVGSLAARGDTPIGAAVSAAAKDIPNGEPATIILVSDGRDECYDADLDGDPARGPSFGPAPCDVATAIAEQRAELRVHVVGLDTSNYDLQSLSCFADATGGSTVQTDDASSLTDQLMGLATGTRRVVEPLGGEPIDGTLKVADAPAMNGAFADTARFTDTLTASENRTDDPPAALAANYDVQLIRAAAFNATVTVFGLPTDTDSTIALTLVDNDGQRQLLAVENDRAGRGGTGSGSVRLVGWAYQQQAQRLDATLQLTVLTAAPVDTLDVELTLDGAAVGGGPPNCPPDTECRYQDLVPALRAHAADLRIATAQAPPVEEVSDPLVSQVDALRAERATLPAAPDPVGRPIVPVVAIVTLCALLAGAVAWRRTVAQQRLAVVEHVRPTPRKEGGS